MSGALLEFYDGTNTRIVFSNTFNVYEDRLIIRPIYGFTLVFVFEIDPTNPDSRLKSTGNSTNKSITITLTNFSNSLGTGTTTKLPIITTNQGKQVYYSVYVSSLGGNSTLKQVTVTLFEQL